jgi:geranylgeranyl pyrophosphate synthase
MRGADNHKREALRPFLLEAGSLEFARRRALELAEQARRELDCLPGSPARAVLEAMADRVVDRES